jgi:cellulose biosynthesis protein BcsQ
VLVVDLDPQGSASWVLGADPGEIEVSTAELLDHPAKIDDALLESGWGTGVDLLSASPRLYDWEHAARRDATRLRDAIDRVADGYDAVLVDCAPSLGHLTTSALASSDLALIVVEPSALGLRGISAVADRIDDIWDRLNPDLDLAGVLVNRVPAVSAEAERRLDDLARVVGRKAVWQPMLPQRVISGQALAERRPIHAYGYKALELTAAYDALWSRLRRLARRAAH